MHLDILTCYNNVEIYFIQIVIGGKYGLLQKTKGTQNQKRIYPGADRLHFAHQAGTVQQIRERKT